ncbi:hypothetical protein ACT3SP_00550 [Brachybacterium sp. AOP43-C2-M15]|uniref:hypothetical protein n=1 Tax=Brachybacterium sp. AOP43-C2-M15 TaxID=3457661 RepID=UPI00403364AB
MSRRRALLAGPLGVLAVLTAAGCSGRARPGAEFDGLGTVPEEVHSGSLLTLDPVEGAQVLLTTTDSIRLGSVGAAESFTAGELGAMVSGRGQATDTPSDHPVPAPEGQRYLVVELLRDGGGAAPSPAPPSEDPEGSTHSMIVSGPDGGTTETEVDLVAGSTQFLMLVPVDPGPEGAVLEVVTDGATQRLSLVDGSLLHTDVPHAYDRQRGVAAHGEITDLFTAERRDAGGGAVVGLSLALENPATAAYRWGGGWAPAGSHFLSVDADIAQWVEPAESGEGLAHEAGELGSATLTLPDGTVIEPVELGPRDGPPGEPGPEGQVWRAWFEIPTDLAAATLRGVARPSESRAGLIEAFADSVALEAALEFGADE